MDEKDCVSRKEHEEFARRMDAENARLGKRVSLLEDNVRQINQLTVSVERMAINMENMLEEQKKQGERLESLEKEPADAYKQIRMAIITSIISAGAGAAVGAILVLL